VRVDGEAVTGVDDVSRILDDRYIGRKVTVTLLRSGEIVQASLVPVERAPGD
jgi:S1-C subfamily serine protease